MTNIFKFNEQPLRHIELGGGPWFVAADICRCLGLKPNSHHGSFGSHLAKLDPMERRSMPVADAPTQNNGGVPRRRPQTLITESGVYKLILRAHPSRPSVAAFQDWVTKEVLPSIRRTGGYLLNEAARETAHADAKQATPGLSKA